MVGNKENKDTKILKKIPSPEQHKFCLKGKIIIKAHTLPFQICATYLDEEYLNFSLAMVKYTIKNYFYIQHF